MKKLTFLVSAIAAAFCTATAKADVSVSGSANVAYLSTSGAAGADEELAVGQL